MWAIPRRRISIYKGITKDIFCLLIKNELINGQYIKMFERKFATYIGTSDAVSVSSGTVALSLILENLSLNKGDEVILPAYTFSGIPMCIKALGLLPRFVDIDSHTDNLDIVKVKEIINPKTKVIIATHIFGRPCELEEILRLGKEKGIFIIEDCAHAIGSRYKGRKVGSFGDAAFFSFSLTKPFNTFNGGMLVSDNHELIDRIRYKVENLPVLPRTALIKNILVVFLLYFITKPIVFTFVIYPVLLLLSFVNKDIINLYNKIFKKLIFYGIKKYKFSNLQSLVGLKTMQFYDKMAIERYNKVSLFNELCEDNRINVFEVNKKDDKNVFHYYYIIKHHKKDAIYKDLLRHGIDTGKYVAKNCGKLFDDLERYPNTEDAYSNSFQLPIEHCNQKNMLVIIRVLKRYMLEK